MNPKTQPQPPIILFDGVCNLCNSSVQFILRRDRQGRFKLASLQSDFAQKLLDSYRFDSQKVDSILLVQNGKIWAYSGAALRIFAQLGGLWALVWIFWLIPAPIRDLGYKLIARNRYRWFGKSESCMLPQKGWEGRFLQ